MTEDIIIPTMLTIQETAEKTGLPKYFIRQLVLHNEICYLRAGRKYLVNFDKLMEYLEKKQNESVVI